MSKEQTPPKRRKDAAPPKPAKPGTPVRNSILLLIFVALITALVVLLPKEPTRNAATMLVPGEASDDVSGDTPPLRLSEIMASNSSAYPDESGNYPDWIEVENTGTAALNLGGIGLSDREDRILFLFPDVALGAGEFAIIFCDDTNVSDPSLPMHARFKISSLGESIHMFDRSGVLYDTVTVPPMGSDLSYSLTAGGWLITEEYTPGYPNTAAGRNAFTTVSILSANGLVINELVASNRTTLQDEDGEYPDWIELYNGGSMEIDLYNYCLSDDPSNPTKWRFPQGATLSPGEYYLVFASGKNRLGADGGPPHANFKLAAEGETVQLSDLLGQAIDRTTYDNLGKDVSWGRGEGGTDSWQTYSQPTPGLPNNRQGAVEMDARMRAGNASGVFISEVVTASTGLETPFGWTSYDYIELVNRSDTAVSLHDWGLSDRVGRPRKWQFDQVTIGPGEHLLVFTSGLTESPTGSGALHAEFRLSALGETVVLADPKGAIIDRLSVPKLEQNNAYGRDFDRGGLFYFEEPTPGLPNTTEGFAGYAVQPVILTAGGIHRKSVSVAVEAPAGVQIRYTLDGSDPTQHNGMDYQSPITIDETAPLRVRGFADGLKPSDIATETFFINIYHSLPIVALTCDPENLYNPQTGMLAEDPEMKATYIEPPFEDLVYWQKNRYPGHFEYYSPEGSQLLSQDVELQLNGQFSLDQAQKSFRVTARARYGASTLAYPFFEDRPFSQYQSIILRNGGNDGRFTRIVDALQSKIIDWTGADILHMASTPVIVFLNGEYWGHYNLRDRINKHSIAAYEGWTDPEQIDFIKGDDQVISGNYDNYEQLLDFVRTHDLSQDPQALETVLNWIDVDSYFDFMIFQIYFGNTDTGNIKFYRQRTPDAKWRWVVYDLDWAYFSYQVDTTRSWLKPEGSGSRRFENILIRKLLEVPALQDKFLTRYGELYANYFTDTERILALVDEMIAVIEPELSMHYQRWAGLTSPLVSEEPATPEGNLQYWRGRVDRLRGIIQLRPQYAWDHAQAWFELTEDEMIRYFGPRMETVTEDSTD